MREALKLALEALEGYESCIDGYYASAICPDIDKAINAIKEALAQPWPDLTEQQRESYQKGHNDGVAHHKQAVKAAQPEQEPVGRVCFRGDEVVWTNDPPESGTLLYTSPPKREWADLTDKQKKHAEATCMKHGLDAAIYYVQITLKVKNT